MSYLYDSWDLNKKDYIERVSEHSFTTYLDSTNAYLEFFRITAAVKDAGEQ